MGCLVKGILPQMLQKLYVQPVGGGITAGVMVHTTLTHFVKLLDWVPYPPGHHFQLFMVKPL